MTRHHDPRVKAAFDEIVALIPEISPTPSREHRPNMMDPNPAGPVLIKRVPAPDEPLFVGLG